jgi:hypothetical protein
MLLSEYSILVIIYVFGVIVLKYTDEQTSRSIIHFWPSFEQQEEGNTVTKLTPCVIFGRGRSVLPFLGNYQSCYPKDCHLVIEIENISHFEYQFVIAGILLQTYVHSTMNMNFNT